MYADEESTVTNSNNNGDITTPSGFEVEIAQGEPTMTGNFNMQHISDSGVPHEWEIRYLHINDGSLTIKESADDRITRGIISLHDIVEIERLPLGSGPNPEDKYILRIQMRSKTQYKMVLDSYSTLMEWTRIFERHKGIMREEDINPPPPVHYTPQKHKYTLKDWFANRRLFGEAWMVYLFIAYTIMLVILFSVLWTQYLLPFRGITQVPTQCFVLKSDYEYLWKKNYDLIYDVTYTVGNETVEGTIHRPCGGASCPDQLDDYPTNELSSCYYDEDDTDFVFFKLQPYVNKRYSIVFGVCGGLFAPWLICVVTLLLVRWKTVSKIIRNTCC
ncbi:hypothetical protein DLAC_06128 [Tieghemostelium lacteum]|uniref:PH domain-containing protein n=1 Tax=Tieghemostelium lacteum TaxID=361077 RepID=A0A151ZHQ0_TIELA|nr:hypothetical protein DLAC_06128 [Tieghemostelium lacteum]|eukprot:KYQ93437.1 hypothetical protein DLAC_06128 [Tieghemostelium lacteum]